MIFKKGQHIDEQNHGILALWAAECAEHTLAYFKQKHPDNDRPQNAIDAARAWVRGELTVSEAPNAA